jgi:hypothetical protein
MATSMTPGAPTPPVPTRMPPASNDNAWEPPVVRIPAGRPYAAYARSENLILPARFARRLPEWSRDRPELRPLDRIWKTRAARTMRIFDRLFAK